MCRHLALELSLETDSQARNRHDSQEELASLWLHLSDDLGEILRIQHDFDSPVLRPAVHRVVTGHRPGIRKADRLKTLPIHATPLDEESHDIRGTGG